MFSGISDMWKRTNWGSDRPLSRYMLEQLALQYFASGVETTAFKWVLIVVKPAPYVAVSPSYASLSPPAVMWILYGSAFLGLDDAVNLGTDR